jgi:hypothetical protein
VILSAQRVAGGDVFQAHRRSDIARADFLDFLALIGMHLQDAADALFLDLSGCTRIVAGIQRARVDTEERQRADERIVMILNASEENGAESFASRLAS